MQLLIFIQILTGNQIMQRIFKCVLIIFLLSQASFAAAITVKIDPENIDLSNTGNTFDVDIKIEGVADLGGFEFEITFDPSVLSVDDVVEGPFLASTGRTTSPVGPEIDNVNGKVSFGGFSFGDLPGPGGEGTLSTVTFIVHRVSSGVLDLKNVQVTDTAASIMTVDSTGDANLLEKSDTGGSGGGGGVCFVSTLFY